MNQLYATTANLMIDESGTPMAEIILRHFNGSDSQRGMLNTAEFRYFGTAKSIRQHITWLEKLATQAEELGERITIHPEDLP